MAKHLASPYLPGKRAACWRKIKPRRLLPVVIIGWIPGREGVGSLLVAALWEGVLRYVANVRAGFTTQQRRDLARLLEPRRRSRPMVPCPHRGLWVEPELYCQVRFLEWTRAGRLRAASFRGLLSPPKTCC